MRLSAQTAIRPGAQPIILEDGIAGMRRLLAVLSCDEGTTGDYLHVSSWLVWSLDGSGNESGGHDSDDDRGGHRAGLCRLGAIDGPAFFSLKPSER